MEQFLESCPIELTMWLIDRSRTSLSQIARFADQYVSLRKSYVPSNGTEFSKTAESAVMTSFKSKWSPKPFRRRYGKTPTAVSPAAPPVIKPPIITPAKTAFTSTAKITVKPVCYYCKLPNHRIAECHKRMRDESKNTLVKDSMLIASHSAIPFHTGVTALPEGCTKVGDSLQNTVALPVLPVNPLFAPFCKPDLILSADGCEYPIHVLRDTAALQFVILSSSIPTTGYAHTGDIRLLRGITNTVIEVPLVSIHLKTDGIDQTVLAGLIEQLPEGVDFLLGNDMWFMSHPLPESNEYIAVVTRSVSASLKSVDGPQVPITQTDIASVFDSPSVVVASDIARHYGDLDLNAVQSSDDFVQLQKADIGLQALTRSVEDPPFPVGKSFSFNRKGALMHHSAATKKLPEADQLVIPTPSRNKMLHLAHDIPAAGHLGFAKTQARMWNHVYWPHIWKDTLAYIRSCDRCQRVGKGPKPAPAPLIPLPVVSEPVQRIAIDTVGPLPVCVKSKNRFILTILDLATHYPEAVALPDHTAKTVASA